MSEIRIARDDVKTRTHLLDKAKSYLRLNGFKGTTVRNLANHLGLSTSSLYYHFPNKEAILSSCLLDDTLKLIRDTENISLDKSKTVIQRLELFIQAHITFQIEWCGAVARSKKTPHGIVSIVDGMSQEIQEQMRNLERRFVKSLVFILEEGREANIFQIPDLIITAYAIISFGEHLITWYHPNGKIPPDKAVQIFINFAKKMVLST